MGSWDVEYFYGIITLNISSELKLRIFNGTGINVVNYCTEYFE